MSGRVIDDKHRERPRSRDGESVAAQLRDGKTLFFEGKGSQFGSGWIALLASQGYRLHKGLRTIDGVQGLAIWAEKIEPRP